MDKLIDKYVDTWLRLDEIVLRTREKEAQKLLLTNEELDEIEKANQERLDLWDDITQMDISNSVTIRYKERTKLNK